MIVFQELKIFKEIFYLAQGGTAVGTGINTRNFDNKICKEISKLTKIKFYPAKNKFAALAAHDSIVNFSGTLNTTAVCLMKSAMIFVFRLRSKTRLWRINTAR